MSEVWQSFSRMGADLVAALPRLLVGLIALVAAVVVGQLIRAGVRRSAAKRREHYSVQIALGRMAMAAAVLLGLLIGVTVAFPTFTPANMISALGIGGIAAGFAFKDIFQNFLAGILLLITKPFRVDDQIAFGDYEGVVEEIQTRATLIKTYDGRRVVIPNADLFINPVIVNTAFAKRRMQYDIGIGFGDDIEKAKQIILGVMRDADGVSPDPLADVIVVGLGAATVNLRARWWSDSRIADVLLAQDRVLGETKRRLQAAGVDLPFPTQQILFHDQTEETDGDRTRQREGWPPSAAGNPAPVPMPPAPPAPPA